MTTEAEVDEIAKGLTDNQMQALALLVERAGRDLANTEEYDRHLSSLCGPLIGGRGWRNYCVVRSGEFPGGHFAYELTDLGRLVARRLEERK